MKQRMISLFTVLCMVVSFIPSMVLPAAAEASVYGYGTNVLLNPYPTSNDYWERENCSYGKYLGLGKDDRYIIGARTGENIAVRQRVTLTDADVIRANNGELTLSASGKFYAQGSRNLTANLNIICYNAAGAVLVTYNDRYSKYSISGRTETLTIGESPIPAGTSYIVYEGRETLGNGGAFFGMYEFSMIFFDKTTPAVQTAPYLYAVNHDTSLPAYVMPEDEITYAIDFSEPVTVSKNPAIDLSIAENVSYDITYSADRQTVYFTTTLANIGTNTNVQLKKIAGLSVRDDAGNEYSYSDEGLSVGNVLYKSVFNVAKNLTYLNLTGNTTVQYKTAYAATLTPVAGYKLPGSITVKVDGRVITDYSYDSAGGQILINSAATTGNIEITAAALPQTYTITLDMQGGSGGTERMDAVYLESLPSVTPPARDGYTFGGYYTERNGSGTQYYEYDGNSEKNYDKTGNITLYAKWTPKEYTVTLDAQGGSGSGTVTATYEKDMPVITKPVRTGYTFSGYYTEQNGAGVKYYNADATSARKYDKTDGLTLYAAWTANAHTVTFDKQNGIGGTDSVTATYDQALPVIEPPAREGYTFDGYFENINGEGVQYYYANGASAKTFNTDSGITLYAKWIPNTYDVMLNAQGGSGGVTVTATYDSQMPVIVAPDKPGYIFGGYFSEMNGGGTKYYNADCSSAAAYKMTEGITLYAYWTPITYNIQLYSRGENVGSISNVTYGALRLPSAESLGISYANHNFVGWNIYDEQNWAMYIADTDYSAGLVTEQGKTAYVYAAWLEKDKYTVTYDANGGEGAPSAVEAHVDETITLSSSVPTRQNYTFIGWAETSNAAAAQYQPGDRFTMGNSIVTLFAVWKKNPELSYNANGGIFSTYAGVTYPAAGSSVTLTSAQPHKEGYVFLGWAENETAATADILSSPYTMPDRDTVLYAVYEPIQYEVKTSAASGYSINGIDADGYKFGEYAEFTVSGANPKVYINGVRVLPDDGKYRFEVRGNSSVVVSDSSSVNVIYHANGGMNAPVDMKVYTNGNTAYITSVQPDRTGYIFSGWSKTPDFAGTIYHGGDTILMSAEDAVLYAVWEPINYTVKYNANGGSGIMTSSSAAYDQEFALAGNIFQKDGNQFAGWSYAPNGEIAYVDGAVVKNLADVQGTEITLYAVWESAKTTVLFCSEGGTSGTPSCEVEYGQILPNEGLMAPKRYGFIFAGYYTSANKAGELVYDQNMNLSDYYKTNPWNSVSSEFYLYAAWEPVKYNVAFINGAGAIVSEMEAVYGQSFSLPKADMLEISVPEGYSFKGWSIASGSDTVYYRDGQEITTGLTGENTSTVYLYAVILKNETYTVTLPSSGEGYHVYYDGNELTTEKDVTVSGNEELSFSVSVEDGYSADKMAVLANGIMLGAVQTSANTYSYNIKNISADTSVNLYNVTKETFSIILNDGTGYSVSPKNTTVESGKNFSFAVTLKDGYKTAVPVVYVNGQTLDGTRNGDVFTYTVTSVKAQPVISISVTPNPQYTVTFVSNGSIFLISTVEAGLKVSQPIAPDRYGYTFGGWYIDKDCNQPYDFQTDITSAVTLYAKWIANTYTVEYDENTTEPVLVPGNQTKLHDTVLALSSDIPARTGYTFTGWNTKADGTGTSYRAGDELNLNSNITLYAQWEINRYAVSLVMGDGVNGSISANEVAYNGTVKITAASADGYDVPVITAIPQENAVLISDGNYQITGPVCFVATADAKTIYTAEFYYSGGLYYTQSSIEGNADTIILPNPPEKQGYTFIGWFSQPAGGTEINESTILDQNMSVYAQFTANTLHVTPAQSGSGYTVASTNSTNVAYGGNYTFNVTIAEHYNAENMRVYANGVLLTPSVSGNVYTYTLQNISADQTITVTGVEIDQHTVTYVVDGQVYTTETVNYGEKITEPLAPSKQGVAFAGWASGGVIWDYENDTLTSDITFTAQWSDNVYTVTPAQSGSGYTVASTDSTNVAYGGNYTFNVTIAEHYNAENMRVYANGVLLTPSVSGNVYTYTLQNISADQTITVTGVEIDQHTVTYVVDGQVYRENNVVYGSKLTLPANPSKEGMRFAGWAYETSIWDFDNDIVECDMTLIAQWEILTYHVTLPSSNAAYTVTGNGDMVQYGGEYSFAVAVASGYNMDNIIILSNGTELSPVSIDGDVIYCTISNITENITVTIRGIGIDTYAITYHSAVTEYVANMPEGQIKEHGGSIILSNLEPQRYGYTFEGWAAKADGEVIYNPGAEYTVDEDLDLYAVWVPMTYTITYETNGGMINSGAVNAYVYSVGAVLPTDVTKDGFDFIGWYDNEFFEGVRVTTITPTDSGNKKYYANYSVSDVIPNSYEGEYDGNAHILEYALVNELTVQTYQWYFKATGTTSFVPVESDSALFYMVRNVSDSGEYYCYVEALQNGYVVRFNTGTATVHITKKPLSIKANDAEKCYDALPLTSGEFAFTDGTNPVSGHIVDVTMTAASTITNAGTTENAVQDVAVYDMNHNDVTANYEIKHTPGTLTVTKLPLTIEGNTVSKYKNTSVTESELYKISGTLNSEKLSLDNVSLAITNSKGQTFNSLEDIITEIGTYTVVITFNGITGDSCENYIGSGSIISNITVKARPSGGSSGGGSGSSSTGGGNSGGSSGTGSENTASNYVISFDTNGAEKIENVTVVENQILNEPEKPDREGYIFEGWYTDKALTTEYNFSSKVTKSFTLYAKWTKNITDNDDDSGNQSGDEPSDEDNLAWENPFDDVKQDDWYYDDVCYAVENALFNGTTNKTFDPNGIITRAMLVTVLYRAEGNPEVTGTVTFEDVDAKAYYAEAVVWGQQNGIIKGYSETEFAPDQNIIREQIAAIIHRYAKYKGIDTTDKEGTNILSYIDFNNISAYAIPSVQYVVGSDLMKGKSTTTFNPNDNATRAEIAAILHRLNNTNKE